ncbi:uncharacterized protein [Hoplias malabaricus]
MKQYETETGQKSVLPALQPVYQSAPAEWTIDFSKRKASLLLEILQLQTEKKPVKLRGWSQEESEIRSFLQCLPYISQLRLNYNYSNDECVELLPNLFHQAAESQRQTGEKTLELLVSVCSYSSFPFEDSDLLFEQCDFLLELYSHVKKYETETGQKSVLPALLPVYQSTPAEWIIHLSERKTSLLLEILQLQTEKKSVELWSWSQEESEISFLQCLPYISQLRLNYFYPHNKRLELLKKLFHQAAKSQRQRGEKTLELLVSVCSYSSFPFGDEEDPDSLKEQSDFLLELYAHMKQYETETGQKSVLPGLQPVYQSAPAEWIIHLSERKTSLLLEILQLQTEKKPVKLWGWSQEESEIRSFLQCLPYISQLRITENLVPSLNRLVFDWAKETELVAALFAALDYNFTVNGVLSFKRCRALGQAISSSASRLNLILNFKGISLKGATLLFKHVTHLYKLRLNESALGRMVQAHRVIHGAPLVIEELYVVLKRVWSTRKLSRVLSSLTPLLNLWAVQCLNLSDCELEPHYLIGLVCHPECLKIRLSKVTLQHFPLLIYELKDRDLCRFFLRKVGGDLTSCTLSWEELIYFLQLGVDTITVNMRKNKITREHVTQLIPLLAEVKFKSLDSSVVLSIIREIYETGSAGCVPSLLNSVENHINLNNRVLDSVHCDALCFTLQHCTNVSLSLLWTSIPEWTLVNILPLLSRVSNLSVDRHLLLSLLHYSTLVDTGTAAYFSSLRNRLDFSCSTALDVTTKTERHTLHLTTEDCRVISNAVLKAQKPTELILLDCELEDAGVDSLFKILHTVRLRCSKALLLKFLTFVRVGTEVERMTRAEAISKAVDGEVDLSETQLDLQVCRLLALVLEYTEGLSELDLSHCQLTDSCLELLLPHLHKIDVLDLSHNNITDRVVSSVQRTVSISSNIQTVRLFGNRITDIGLFQKDKRFEIWK